MSDFVKIRIGSEFEGRGFDQANAELKKLTTAGADFVNVLKAGVGIDLGGRLVQSLAAVPQILQEAIANGVRFNAELEGARLGIAAIIKQFDASGKTSFDQALGKSAEAIELLKQKAMESPATFQQLVQGFQAVSGAATGAGIGLKDQVDLIVLMSQALSGLGIRSDQIVQESRALITGNINEDAAAAKILGITKAQVEAAREQGNLYEFLSGKLAAFSEAGKRGQGTLTTALSNLEDALTQLQAKVSEPIFEALKEGVLALNSELGKPEAVEALKALGFEIAEIVKDGMAMIQWAVKNADTLATMAHAAGILAVALAAMKIAQITVSLGAWAVALLAGKTALDVETAALARNTAAQAANATARGGTAAAAGVGGAVAAGGAALAGRAEWLAAQRTLQAGGTTFAKYGSNALGGVVLGAAGASAARTAAVGGAGMTAGAIAGIVALGAAAAAAGIAIGSWIEGVKKAGEVRTREANTKDFMGGNAENAMGGLRDAAAGVDRFSRADTEAAIRKQIIVEEAGAANLDGVRQANAQTRLGQLREMLAGLTDTQKINDALLTTEEKMTAAAEARAKAYEDAAAKNEQLEWVKNQSTANTVAAERIGAQSEDPATRIAMLKASALRQRIDLGNSHELKPGADIYGGTPAELVNSAQSDAGRAAVQGIADTQRQITEEQKKQDEIYEQLLADEAKLYEESGARADKAREEYDARQAALADLKDEHGIQEALIDGNKALAEELQRQKKLREDIAALVKAGVPETQAKAEAQITADLEKRAKDKERSQRQEGIEADMVVDAAGTHRSKKGLRDAQENALRVKKKREFEDAGYQGADLDRMVASAVDIHRRQTRGDRIGGATVRSGRDTLGGGIDNLAGLGSGSTALTGGKGLTADADWNKLFQNGISPLVPRGGMAAGGKPGEGGIDKAAAAAEGAEKSLKDGTGKMSKALDAMKTTAGTTFEQMTATLNEVKGQFQTMQTSLKDLQTQLDNIG